MSSDRIERIYVGLTFLETLAASLIWGVNTLFLLDAGLSLTGSFVANAAFSAGMVLFEVPTGVVADGFGRRRSFLLGAATLVVGTGLYLLLWRVGAGLGWWVVVSALLGLGFTFFSGATDAWLVDALQATGYRGSLEAVLGKGQVAFGAAMLIGTIGGGALGQLSLGLPYVVRAALLVAVFAAAALWMRDLGFEPSTERGIGPRLREIVSASLRFGWRNRPVRLLAIGAFFTGGTTIWIFYAFQPYVLDLVGDPDATWLAGVAAAGFSSSQIVGGALVRRVRALSTSRTRTVARGIVLGTLALAAVGAAGWMPRPVGFWIAIVALFATSLVYAITEPFRAALLNDLIPSRQRATILSFDSLAASAGGAALQPALGKAADVWSLAFGYLLSALLFLLAAPFVVAVRAMGLPADRVGEPEPAPNASADPAPTTGRSTAPGG